MNGWMDVRIEGWKDGLKFSHEDVISQSLIFEADNDTNEGNPPLFYIMDVTATLMII
jgi:hypothetical protein